MARTVQWMSENAMNHALAPSLSGSSPSVARSTPSSTFRAFPAVERLRRLRSLLRLLAVYAVALFTIVLLSEGGDIGCLLLGIAGHVVYSTRRVALAWRDASWIDTIHGRG